MYVLVKKDPENVTPHSLKQDSFSLAVLRGISQAVLGTVTGVS